ncbi:MAG TPA: MoaD/ThiS family protein [Candidatus Cloacimonadota bacterium]|nr:MoaD/ThiS family protein [Candidatus Cloacimonadota bacterium]HOD54652.1 MoaD/ThiS family protein [Candidatus Cloacimonadota bacterium]HPM00826.1 MoaD/ThiS family protein [Candidatus Cloacimonadota bacterium]
MRIKVKLFATLRLDRGKIVELEVDENATVSEVMAELQIKRDEIAILLVNGLDGKMDTKLKDSDTISVFPPVGGG